MKVATSLSSTEVEAEGSPGISIVVPVYNSQESLPLLVQRLHSVLEDLALPHELVLVNDGSRDQSWSVIERLVRDNNWIRGVNLLRNFGQHNALLCGIRVVRYEVIVTIDDDLQHPPEEIPKLLAKLHEGYDVVYGRPEKHQQGLWRDFASWIVRLSLKSAMGVNSARDVFPFRAFHTRIRRAFADYRSPNVVIDVLLTWGATNFGVADVHHERRAYGRSNYTFSKLLSYSLSMTTGFSTLPLRVASFIGFATSIFGLAILSYAVVRYFTADSPQGFTFLASIISIFSGAQLLGLGIIGEYLGRLHFRSMERPTYVVYEDISNSSA